MRTSERLSGFDERGGRRWRLNAYTLFTFTLNDEKRLLVFLAQRRLTAAVVYELLGCVGEWTASDSPSALANTESALKVVLLSYASRARVGLHMNCVPGQDGRGFRGKNITVTREAWIKESVCGKDK